MTRRFFALTLAAASRLFAGLTIPRQAKDVLIQTQTTAVLLSQYHGKVVAIAFALPNCEDCHRYMRTMNALQTELGPRGFQAMVGVFNVTKASEIDALVSAFRPSYAFGAVKGEEMVDFTQVTPEMKPVAPIVCIVDRKGMIRAEFFGNSKILTTGNPAANLKAEIEKYL